MTFADYDVRTYSAGILFQVRCSGYNDFGLYFYGTYCRRFLANDIDFGGVRAEYYEDEGCACDRYDVCDEYVCDGRLVYGQVSVQVEGYV